MPVATDALIADTTHLSAEEFGAYCLILFATWRNNGKALRDDDLLLSRVCRVSLNKFKAKIKPMLSGFFNISDGYLHQKRLEKEWVRVANVSAIRSAAGKLGGRPKSLNSHNSAKANGSVLPKQNESTHTHIQKERREYIIKERVSNPRARARDGDQDREFETWYLAYPRKEARADARKAFAGARKTADLEQLTSGVERYVANKPDYQDFCLPATWLRQERWRDEPRLFSPKLNEHGVTPMHPGAGG